MGLLNLFIPRTQEVSLPASRPTIWEREKETRSSSFYPNPPPASSLPVALHKQPVLNESPLPRPQRPLANSIDLDSCLRRRVDQRTDAMRALLLLGSLLVSLESALLVRAVGTRRIVLGWPWGSLSQAWPLPVTSWSR